MHWDTILEKCRRRPAGTGATPAPSARREPPFGLVPGDSDAEQLPPVAREERRVPAPDVRQRG